MSVQLLAFVEVDAQESPLSFSVKYILIRGVLTIVFGTIMLLTLPLLSWVMLAQSDAGPAVVDQMVMGLQGELGPALLNAFFNPYFTLIVGLNLCPWLLFLLGMRILQAKFLLNPEKNLVATITFLLFKVAVFYGALS